MLNTNDKLSSYHISEGQKVTVDINTCIDDALVRLASSTSISGSFSLSTSDVSCSSTISSIIDAGFKTVTSTATSTSDLGSWTKTVVVKVNVSSSPISIDSYNESKMSYQSYIWCGDGTCNGSETGVTCSVDCPVCGNGILETGETCDDGNLTTESCGDGATDSDGPYCDSECSVVYAGAEACDDNNVVTEYCGDGIRQSVSTCSSDCKTVHSAEACDYTGAACGSGIVHYDPVPSTCTFCNTDCSACSKYCF